MPDLADILAGRGSALLGAGGFSIVVTDPECPRTAVKIGPSLSDAWPAWAAFALDNPGPHVPVVHSLRWIWSRSGAPLFYVAEMERLEPADAARAWLVRAGLFLVPLAATLLLLDGFDAAGPLYDAGPLTLIVVAFPLAYLVGYRLRPTDMSSVAEPIVGASWGAALALSIAFAG